MIGARVTRAYLEPGTSALLAISARPDYDSVGAEC